MKQLLKNFSWVVAGNIVSTLLRAVTILIIVRMATPAAFAIYAGVYGALVFGKALSDLGLNQLIIRDRSIDKSSKIHGFALKINTVTSTLLGVIGTLGIALAGFIGLELAWILLPMAATAALEKNADTWRSVFLADGRAHLMVSFTLARRFITLGVVCLLLFWASYDPITSMVIAEFIAAIVSAITVRFSTQQVVHLPKGWETLTTVKLGRPFWIHGLAMQTRNLDVALVSLVAPVIQSGYFAAATRLSGP